MKTAPIFERLESFSPSERVDFLIALGRALPSAPDIRTEANRISGCQSELYLETRVIEGRLFFRASSDALVSLGLAALLIEIFNGKTADEILSLRPPFHLITSNISPSRSNGFASLLQRIQRESFLVSIRASGVK